MRLPLAVLAFGLPLSALAQVQNPYSQPAPPPPQYNYAQQYPGGYPAQAPQQPYQPAQQQQQYRQSYPQGGYPPPQAGYGYPQQPQQATVAQPPPVAPPPSTHLTLATRSTEVATLVTACANALDNEHLDVARKSCGQALEKEDTLAFTHYLIAQAVAPDASLKELARAAELTKKASPGERLFIEAYRAMVLGRTADAKKSYDQLIGTLSADARARVARGQFRQGAGNDLAGAVIDFEKAVEIDPKYPAAYKFLGFALLESGRTDEAATALKKYAELAPNEPNAFDSLAKLALRRGMGEEAVTAAKKALSMDASFLAANARLGDALLFSGKSREARRVYGALVGADDATLHHEGAMREARSWLFDARGGDCERALAAEAELAAKAKRPADQAEALVELARVQLDRGALADSGQSLRMARQTLEAPEAATLLLETTRRQMLAEAMHGRALLLGAIGERQLAMERADEMGVALKLAGDAHAGQKATALKGWIAARNGDDKAALGELANATKPTLRMALALAAARAGETERARGIMEELARRMVNDIEGALTRPRAAAWLKAQPPRAVSGQAATGADKVKAD